MVHQNVRKAEQIKFSLSAGNHIAAMKAEIDFLAEVAKYPLLYTPGPVLNNAIRRYETLFLPSIAKEYVDGKGVITGVPLDIEWVWHCHMLSPFAYRTDCQKLVEYIPDHAPPKSATTISPEMMRIWDRHVDKKERLVVDLANATEFVGGPGYTPQSSYDLVGAVTRQSAFYYNVSLPHYKDDGFLSNAILRYKMMLQLKTFYPDAFLVPCYDMDLAWHTHQLHPYVYKNDTVAYLGKMFNHDDNMTDRSAESYLTKSEEETKRLWHDSYDSPMALNGAMYRGVSPLGKLGSMTTEESLAAADMLFKMHLSSITAENSNSTLAVEKMKMAVSLGRQSVDKRKVKRQSKASTRFNFGEFKMQFSLHDDHDKTLSFSFSQTEEGCCMSADDIGHVALYLNDFLLRNGGAYDISKDQKLDGSSVTVSMQGKVAPPQPGKVRLKLKAGLFSNVVMPETVESMWGPVPLRRLPAGAVNHCTVANHVLQLPGKTNSLFTARVIHCLPLLMSCVQIYCRDKMVAVSHLIGTEQLPEDTNNVIKGIKNAVYLRRGVGERAMLIKTSAGDRIIVFGHWANMKKGVPGTRRSRGVPGNPGNLRIRVSQKMSNGTWVNNKEMDVNSNTIALGDVYMDLKKGTVEIGKGADVGEKLCFTFSVAVLTCLCQPPPPGVQPPKDADKLGVLPPPPRYQSTNRGAKSVTYNDGADLAFIAAAGWMMASPSNYFMHNYYMGCGWYFGGCGGACAGLAVCAACGGVSGDACACAGDGGDGGGGCGGCGGCGGGCGG